MIAIHASSRQNNEKSGNTENGRPGVTTGHTTDVVDIVFVGQSENLGKTPKHDQEGSTGPNVEKPETEGQSIIKKEKMAKYTNIRIIAFHYFYVKI